MLELGTGKAIIAVMQTHRNTKEVIGVALTTMKHLAGNLFDFVKKGAGSEVLSAMNNFVTDEEVQYAACGAIKVLATSRPNAEILVEWDVGVFILNAMRNHKYNEKVQKSACSAVWSLLLTNENKDKLWQMGLAHFVIEAMRIHKEAERLQEYATGALWTFE